MSWVNWATRNGESEQCKSTVWIWPVRGLSLVLIFQFSSHRFTYYIHSVRCVHQKVEYCIDQYLPYQLKKVLLLIPISFNVLFTSISDVSTSLMISYFFCWVKHMYFLHFTLNHWYFFWAPCFGAIVRPPFPWAGSSPHAVPLPHWYWPSAWCRP